MTLEPRTTRLAQLGSWVVLLVTSLAAAPPAFAADCQDGDGDGFVTCLGCDAPAGKVCGDCDDGDATIRPGAAERCDDAVDNNCDGNVNEGFHLGTACLVCDGDGCIGTYDFCLLSSDAELTCAKVESNACLTQGQGMICDPGGLTESCALDGALPEIYADEGVGPADMGNLDEATCRDLTDNDCDGLFDRDDPDCQLPDEVLCDGIDDNGNGIIDEDFALGDDCTRGTGVCANHGVVVCTADTLGSQCSVEAFPPFTEDAPGSVACADGLDNDCDGEIDLDDPGCQAAEVCDGVDNDGDHEVDEGFPDLGEACVAGIGACRATGVRICSVDGAGTVCGAAPPAPSLEGPLGITCNDGVDNDCDGLTDAADPDCIDASAAGLSCALAPVHKDKGDPTSCEGQYQVVIDHAFGPGAVVTAELWALEPDGSAIPYEPAAVPVENGALVHLASRTDPRDFKVEQRGKYTDVYAPVPLLVVTAHTGERIVRAFCSPIAYLDVMKPSGEVVSASEGDRTEVEVAIPRVDPTTLSVTVDGVDLLAGLGLDPAIHFPGGPYAGSVLIGGREVAVSGLLVDTAARDALGSNSLTMLLEDLGGGGHIVVVDGEPCDGRTCPSALPSPRSSQCHSDNVSDAGIVSVFEVVIHEPEDGAAVAPGSTRVLASVRHGRDIASASVDGVPASTAGEVCETTDLVIDGEAFTVGQCALDLDTLVPQTNFSAPALALGTFDLGQNIVTVGARDDLQTQTYDRNRFTMGDVLAPQIGELPPEALAQIQGAATATVERTLGAAAAGSTALFGTTVSVWLENAIFFGVTPEALDAFFASTCEQATVTVLDAVRRSLMNATYQPIEIDLDKIFDNFDVTVNLQTMSVSFDGAVTCHVVPNDGYLAVNVTLPKINVALSVKGSNKVKDPVTKACLVSVSIDTQADTSVSGAGIDYEIDESLALRGGTATPRYVQGTSGGVSVDPDGIHLGCIGGSVAKALPYVTFGLLRIEKDVQNVVGNALDNTGDAVQLALRSSSADPLAIRELGLDTEDFTIAGMSTQEQLSSVRITPAGVTASLRMILNLQVPDPRIVREGLPGVPLTAADGPTLPVAGNQGIYFVASDDLFGLIYAALTAQGATMTSCVPAEPRVVLADLLPADCAALADATARGRCRGAKGDDCSALPPEESGACDLTQGDMADRRITAATEILFCARNPLAPRMLFHDDTASPTVIEGLLHLNEIVVTMVLDLDGDRSSEPPDLTPNCFDLLPGSSATDCSWARGCFDANLGTAVQIIPAGGGRVQMKRSVSAVQDQVGYQCAGGLYFGRDENLLSLSGGSDPITVIGDNLGTILPSLHTTGVTLGGLVYLIPSSMRALAIDTGVAPGDDCPTCQDFAGFTGQLWPAH